jgi:hypothetical protein
MDISAISQRDDSGAWHPGDVHGNGDQQRQAQVAYGSGEGTFEMPQTLLPETGAGFSVAVGDFNGNGRPDAVIGTSTKAVILLN